MASSAKQVYNLFKKHLTDHDFHFTAHDDDLMITLTVQGDDLPQPTVIRVIEKSQAVQVISPIPTKMPEDKRMEAAVAVAVANYGFINGCFDLDMSDGEIRFRIAQGFHDIDFSDELARYMLGITFMTTDQYNDRFFALGKGMMSLEQFIEKEGKN